MPEVPITERLAPYRLAQNQLQMQDIRLEPNQQLMISRQNPQVSGRMVYLQPNSIADLKAWIGIPDQAFTALRRPEEPAPSIVFSGLPTELSASENASLYLAARSAVFGPSHTISPTIASTLSDWIRRLGPRIPFFPANDIYLAAGSQMVIGPDVWVLFARHITVQETARIIVQGTSTKIDCASFRSEPLHPRIDIAHPVVIG
jgi:hypothetical protein